MKPIYVYRMLLMFLGGIDSALCFDSSSGCVAESIHTLPHVERFDVVRPKRQSVRKVPPFTTWILLLQQQDMPDLNAIIYICSFTIKITLELFCFPVAQW